MPVLAIVGFRLLDHDLVSALQVLHRTLADTRAFDGALRIETFQDQTDPTRIAIVELWESPDHEAAYRQWRAGAGASAELRGILAEPPTVALYDHLAEI
jgi:quinol monooxygenase YgiN